MNVRRAKTESKPQAALARNWDRLHLGDLEPYPSPERLSALAKRHKSLPSWLDAQGGAGAASVALLTTWHAFHDGDYLAAIAHGDHLGALGALVANKAAGVFATYEETNAARAANVLETAVQRGERALKVLPDYANAHYMYAFVLGRYSQRISIVKAAAAGHATRVRKALERCLDLEPKHADAHIALGLFHAEIIDKIGALAGGLTYGVSRGEALRQLRRAIELAPQSAIAHLEFAHALVLLGEDSGNERKRLLTAASKIAPLDAMERHDVQQAKRELAKL